MLKKHQCSQQFLQIDVVSVVLQTFYAPRILRNHGMKVNALQLVFKKSFLHDKMTYAVSTWCSYTTAADKQRLEALIRRAVRVRLYPADGPNLHQLVANVDDALFVRIQANEQHVLQQLLPAPTCYKYVLRSRRHYTPSIKTDYDDHNFITRLLYKDMS